MTSDLFMVAFGYHGAEFHGSQIQPDVRTVQGEIKIALEKLGWWSDNCLEISSRTDSGVSVRMNLATISIPIEIAKSITESTFISALNDHSPDDIVFWKADRVPNGTRSRLAEKRLYIYRCEMIKRWPEDVNFAEFKEACEVFVGHHDFSNFCRVDLDRSPIRSIESCQPWLDSDNRVVGFSVVAESFLWNQIRRIASALQQFANNDIQLIDIKQALENPKQASDLGLASADGLLLWEISHPDFSYKFQNSMINHDMSRPPKGKRTHKQWLNLARMENSSMLEREWLALIQDVR